MRRTSGGEILQARASSGRLRPALVWASVLAITAIALCAGPAGARSRPAIVVAVPAHVEVNQPFTLTVRASQVAGVAGYESGVYFDQSAAELSEIKKPARAGAQMLGPLEVNGGFLFGSYSCAVAGCTPSSQTVRGANGSVVLARISLRAEKPGTLTFKIAGTRLVAADGASIAAGSGTQTVKVDVRGPTMGHAYPAPAAHGLPHPASAGKLLAVKDANGDGRVDGGDVAEAALKWNIVRVNGKPCGDPAITAALDVVKDGCLDIGDVQRFASSVSKLGLRDLSSAHRTFVATANPTLVVNSTGDSDDVSPGNGICATSAGVCTLRAAIDEANAEAGANTINFNIAGTGVHTIQLSADLPTLSDTSGGTTIDGYTQPGSAVNTDSIADNAKLMIQIRGTGVSGVNGIMITSANNTIRGLSWFNLKRVIYLFQTGAHNNTIVGDFVGTDATGTFFYTTTDTFATGIAIEAGAASNQVGNTANADRNVISGNGRHGIDFYNEGSNNNVIYNNIIGLSPDGTRRVQNMKHGIDINAGSSFNIIGGNAPGQRNVMSGNGLQNDPDGPAGIEVSHATSTVGNQIIGNYIGTDLTGATAPSYAYNGIWGVHLEDGVNHTIVSNNVIVNSKGGALKIQDPGTTQNQVTNNKIGLTATGQNGPNNGYGVYISNGATNNLIANNTITNNPFGVMLTDDGTDFNTISQNSIYGNSGLGIDIDPIGQVNPNDPGDLDTGANQQLNYPEIASASPTSVGGTACAGCIVEVFIADSTGSGSYGEGKTYVGSATADGSGHFTASISGVSAGQWITTTATDPQGDTSEFSQDVQTSTGSATAPGAPTLNSATAGNSSDILLQWSPPSSNGGATISGYQIYRGTSSGGETLLTTISDQTSYDDVGVTLGTTYYYKVAAVNAVGAGPLSNEKSAAATGNGLIVSDRFGRTVASGWGTADLGGPWSVSLTSRTKVNGSQGQIYGFTAANQDTQTWVPITRPDTETLAEITLDSSNPTGGSYQPRVVARAQADPRNGYAARVIHQTSGQVNWQLSRVDNAGGTGTLSLGYGTLQSSAGAGTSWWIRLRALGTTISAKFWRDGTTEPAAWTVSATDSYWASGVPAAGVYSGSTSSPTTSFDNLDVTDLNSSSPPPPPTVPGPPTLNSATGSNGSVALSWTAPANNGGSAITGYQILRGTSSFGEVPLTTVGNVTSYNDTAVTNGVTYFYTVQAINSVGFSSQSNEKSATPQASGTAPGAPTLNSVTPSSGSVALSWSAPSSNGGSAITGYKVFRGTSSGGETLLTTVGNVTSFTDTTVTNGTTYWYTVAAVNSVGTGAQSNELSATPTASATVPGAPMLNSVTPSDSTIVVAWSAPGSNGGSAITGYKVFRGTSSGGETLLTTLGNVTSFTDTGLTNGTTYWYTVAAVNSVGTGAQSNELSATPQATTNSTVASDAFERSVAAGWGTADTGGDWSVTATDRTKVESGNGVIYGFTAGNKDDQAWLPTLTRANTETLVQINLGPSPTGGNVQPRVMARAQSDPRNGYAARLVFSPSGAITWGLSRFVNAGGTNTVTLGGGTLLSSGGANTSWWIRLRVNGTSIQAKFWRVGTSEPSGWTVSTTDSFYSSGFPAVGVYIGSAVTSPFPSFGFDNFSVVDLGP
jgi:CSLREA domain-containing protein